MSKPIVIYHGSCADGFSAAWVMKQHLGDAEFYAGTYSTEPPDVTDREVYMVDFSYKRPVVEKMLSVAKEIIWIDHHKSAMEDLAGLQDIYDNFYPYVALDKSGAMLAWHWCFPLKAPPYVLTHVQARDLWKFLPNTREVTAVVFSHEYTFENWDALMSISEKERGKSFDGGLTDGLNVGEMCDQGAAIERKHHKDIAEIVEMGKFRMTIGGWNVPVVNVPYTHGSDAGNVMCDGESFAAYFYFKTMSDHVEVEFGLRSSDDGIDVGKLASEYYGGGGHRNAAGFRVSFRQFVKMMETF